MIYPCSWLLNAILIDFMQHLLFSTQIPKAQPSQFKGPSPASINGGRPNNQYRGKELPKGLLICGDHMATATLNGAVESGVSAGNDAAKIAKAAVAAREKATA
jgi:hypothetical protein